MTIHRALNFALAILLAPVLVSGQDQRKSPDQKMGPPARLVFAEGKARHEAHRSFQRAAAKQAQAGKDRQPYEIWFIEFDTAEACRQFEVEGTTLITRFDRFADVFVKSDQQVIEKVQAAPGFKWADVEPYAFVPPPPRPVTIKQTPRQIPDPIIRGGYEQLKGKGVIIAVVDTGLDFRHPDFITRDASGKPTSRVLSFWDTGSSEYAHGVGKPAPVKYPTGAPIGTVYDQATLTKELRGETSAIPIWDTDGHGTSCAGIAAGNGAASGGEYAGVAPLADIIAVRLSSNDGAPGNLDQSFLLNAICEWLDGVAGDQPLVISCSFGATIGGRDGARIDERQLDARFPLDQPNRAICIAAGNEGAYAMHAEAEVRGGNDVAVLAWSAGGEASIEIYVGSDNADDLVIGPWQGAAMPKVHSYLHGITGQPIVQLYPQGDGAVYLQSRKGATYSADAYILGGAFTDDCVSFKKMVGTPGTAANAITVGSYDWNDRFHEHGDVMIVNDPLSNFTRPLQIGSLSSYSTPGPRRLDDLVKPEIAAPGQWFTAPAAANVYGRRDSTGRYQIFHGTSAATPYVAGVVALMMEKDRSLTLGEIKKLLQENASRDPNTGATPNPKWGHGKLDLKAVAKIFQKL